MKESHHSCLDVSISELKIIVQCFTQPTETKVTKRLLDNDHFAQNINKAHFFETLNFGFWSFKKKKEAKDTKNKKQAKRIKFIKQSAGTRCSIFYGKQRVMQVPFPGGHSLQLLCWQMILKRSKTSSLTYSKTNLIMIPFLRSYEANLYLTLMKYRCRKEWPLKNEFRLNSFSRDLPTH